MEKILTTTKEAAEKISALKENTPYAVKVTGRLTKDLLAQIRAAITNEMRITLDLADCTGLLKLPEKAFDTCVGLEEIVLPNCITEIGRYAFFSCILLKKVTMGKSVVAIKKAAFKDCHLLESCDLPYSVAEIGEMSFTKCRRLSEIRVTDNLVKLGKEAFSATGITEFYFPKSLEKVPFRTFFLCKELEKVTIADGVKIIDWQAFMWCRKLSEIQLSDSMQIIGSAAFYKCEALNYIHIPYGVEKIFDYAFSESGLVEINLPDTIIKIEKACFLLCYNLKSIVLPANLKTIEKSLFLDCDKLELVKLPQQLERIKESAFTYCSSLRNLDLPASLRKIEELYSIGLESIRIPRSMKELGRICGCEELKEVYIENPVKLLDGELIIDCPKVSTLELPKEWERHGSDLFVGGKLFKARAFDNPNERSKKTHKEISEYIFDDDMSEIIQISNDLPKELPSTVKSIGKYAFRHCKIKDIIIPNGIEKIAYEAFCNSKVETVEIPDSVKDVEDRCFSECRKLKYVKLPKNLKEIKKWMFADCKNLSKIDFPKALKKIEYRAFKNSGIECLEFDRDIIIDFESFEECKNLISIKFNGKAEIGENAFKNCKNLKSVIFSDKGTKIEDSAFAQCVNLSVTIPQNAEISDAAFSGCKNISIDSENRDYKVCDGILYTADMKNIVSVANFVTEVSIPNSQEIIPSWLFNNCKKLRKVYIPESVNRIKFCAFFNCPKLDIVIIPNSVSCLEDSFVNCKELNPAIPEHLQNDCHPQCLDVPSDAYMFDYPEGYGHIH